eukprot:14106797-Heterocapsa_arctica.AAC.1
MPLAQPFGARSLAHAAAKCTALVKLGFHSTLDVRPRQAVGVVVGEGIVLVDVNVLAAQPLQP